MNRFAWVAACLLVATALAGCTGNFNVKQTEPLRVRLEGGEAGASPSTGTSATSVRVHVDSASGATQQRVIVDKPATVENMIVNVNVVAAAVSSSGGTTTGTNTNTTVEGNATGNQTGGNTTGGNTTSTGSTSTNTTATASTGPTIVNIIVQTQAGETLSQKQVTVEPGATGTGTLNVNVKGKDNIVIVTQAVQGIADVDVSANPA